MSFGLYHRIREYILRENTLESIFARAFLTTTWNLICRATNSRTIRIYITWIGRMIAYVFFLPT